MVGPFLKAANMKLARARNLANPYISIIPYLRNISKYLRE